MEGLVTSQPDLNSHPPGSTGSEVAVLRLRGGLESCPPDCGTRWTFTLAAPWVGFFRRGSHHVVSSVGCFQFDLTCTPRKGKAILSICQANLKAHVRSLGGELHPITAN